MLEQDQLAEVSQHPQSESPEPIQDSPRDNEAGEQTLDERIAKEQEEIAEIEEADKEGEEETGEEVPDEESEEEESGEYKPNTKFKVNDKELEFDPKLKSFLTKETEPLIRELYEKAHGIEAIKTSRDQRTRERDEVQGNYNNLVGEVSRVLNYRKAGDLESFFESVQLTDDDVAKYILEKVRISQLPPEQQAVYTENTAFRKRMNTLEQQFQGAQARSSNIEVQDRLNSLDTVLGDVLMKRTAEDFDTRNGKGSFRTAVINYAAQQKNDLTAPEAVNGFMKMFGINAPKSQPKPGADATKRVVARPKVKTIPNYGGGQASVTATKKPTSVADLRKLAKEFSA